MVDMPRRPRGMSFSTETIKVKAVDSELVELTSLWKQRVTVVAFLRHLGCRFCWEQVASLMKIKDKLDKAEVALICITSGTPAQMQEFITETGYTGELYADPQLDPSQPYKSYDALKLVRGTREEILSPKAMAKAKELADKGFKDHPHLAEADNEWAGNPMQIGGVFVLGVGNHCEYVYRSAYAGDHPDLSQVLAAATGEANPKIGELYVAPTTKAWWERLSVSAKVKPKQNPDPSLGAAVDPKTYQPPKVGPDNSLMNVAVIFTTILALVAAVVGMCMIVLEMEDSYMIFGSDVNGRDLCFTVAVALSIGAWLLQRVNAANGTNTAAAQDDDTYDEADLGKLLTPSQIDQIVLDSGAIQCDCNAIVTDVFSEEVLAGAPAAMQAEKTVGVSELQMTICYLRQFLSKRHPLLGRVGPTCPFVPTSLRIDSIYVSVIDGVATQERAMAIARAERARFHSLNPVQGSKKEMFKAVLMVFKDVKLEDAPVVIDGAQCRLKHSFVDVGLMIGEFHLLNNCPGLHNDKFFPLRTPCPTLAIRNMVPSDIAFLKHDEKFLSSYLELFTNPSNQHRVADRDNKHIEIAWDALRALKGKAAPNATGGK